jgi:squalene-hopene/tetraprenyl-beta-curcumene cyclase
MGQGETTASQTAWAVLGLIAAGRADGDAVRRGIRYLQSTQRSDGSWDEPVYTGTGFPRVFYLKYHLYRIYFPLMALSRYQDATKAGSGGAPVARAEANPGALACRIPAQPRPFEA